MTYMKHGRIETDAHAMLIDVLSEDPEKEERKRRKAEKKESKARKRQWKLWLNGEVELTGDELSYNRIKNV